LKKARQGRTIVTLGVKELPLSNIVHLTIKLDFKFWLRFVKMVESRVDIAPELTLNVVRIPVGSRIFSSPRRPDRPWGSTQPPIQWVPGALSPGVKRPGREADQSPPASAEVKKMWIYSSTSPYAFMA
jgi:hypothetical protein